MSKAMAQWVGLHSWMALMKVLVKANTPRTSSSVLLSVRGVWMACQALCTIAWPSMSMRSGLSGRRGIGSALLLTIVDTSKATMKLYSRRLPRKSGRVR